MCFDRNLCVPNCICGRLSLDDVDEERNFSGKSNSNKCLQKHCIVFYLCYLFLIYLLSNITYLVNVSLTEGDS